MRTKACSPCTNRSRCSKRWSNATKRFLSDCSSRALEEQESDLRTHLEGMEQGLCVAVANWRKLEAYRNLMPADAPDYLKELFCSNTRALLEILAAENCKAR